MTTETAKQIPRFPVCLITGEWADVELSVTVLTKELEGEKLDEFRAMAIELFFEDEEIEEMKTASTLRMCEMLATAQDGTFNVHFGGSSELLVGPFIYI